MSDPVQSVLGLLHGVKPAGRDKWEAYCPAHENPPDGHKRSLSVGVGDGGRVLLHCQGGCALGEVLGAIGLAERDLFPDGHAPAPAPAPSKGRIIATYDYRDSAGTLLYQVVRFDPKDFRQRRPNGNGCWTWKLDGVARVLYRLPALMTADPSAWVFIPEGEKDADNLTAIGLVATTNAGGAGKWGKLSDDGALTGRRVAIIADKDKSGLAHAQDVARRLHGKAAVVKIIDLPDGEADGHPIKDASDWLDSRDSTEPAALAVALLGMADAAPIWAPPAESKPAAEADGQSIIVPALKTIRELIKEHPDLRPPVIHGLLREGETMNVIAQSKKGKSWLVGDMALALATGRPLLGQFPTERGDVLILDNELHRETTAFRIPRIAEARGIPLDEYADRIIVDNLRGRLLNVHDLPSYFANIEPSRFKVVVLDALYRFWPPGANENDNAAIASFYNIIDSLADRQRCSFVLIHHTSKGAQASKALVDVGAGAGAIARAADCHLTMLSHETDMPKAPVVVLDAGPRSWPPVEPLCLRFAWPVWTPAPELDPSALKPDRPRRSKADKPADDAPVKLITDEAVEFVGKYIGHDPQVRATIIDAAIRGGVKESRAKRLLAAAEGRKLAFRWTGGPRAPIQFATVAQPALAATEGAK